jgi:hypothetical protein
VYMSGTYKSVALSIFLFKFASQSFLHCVLMVLLLLLVLLNYYYYILPLPSVS